MKIYDFNNVEISQRRYGGKSGLKQGIVLDGENWLLKFPKSTKEYVKVEISYTTSPLSEYLGSHIYASIGLDVHETRLGEKDGKIVVACKDFLGNGERLDEFRAIKNDYVKGLEEELNDSSTSGNGTDLEELILIMERNPLFLKMPELKKRFWDMFIVDAFIGNNDRNNGNWGVVVNENEKKTRLAPVYDNGNAFNNKSSDKQMHKIISSDSNFWDSAYTSRMCIFLENSKNINPLKYIKECQSEDCNEALKRIVPNIKIEEIKNIINEVPNEYKGIRITSDIQKEFYQKILECRYEKILKPAFEKVMGEQNKRYYKFS